MRVFFVSLMATVFVAASAIAQTGDSPSKKFPALGDMNNTENMAATAKSVKELEAAVKPIFEQQGYALQDFGCHVEVVIGPDGKPQPTVVCGGGWEF